MNRKGHIKIINLLNNNQIIRDDSQPINDPSTHLTSRYITDTIRHTLVDAKLRPKKIEYIGRGINGYLVRAVILDNKHHKQQSVICKCYLGQLPENQIKQLHHELNILTQLQTYPATSEYVNPCLDIIISSKATIAIFPIINGVSMTDTINIISKPDFTPKYRYELVRFIILAVLDAIQRMHDIGISHLQLDSDSILIDLSHNNNSTYDSNLGHAIQNIVNSVTSQESIYYIDNAPSIGIRITNFGIGCLGRDIGCNLKMAALNDPKFPRKQLACVEAGGIQHGKTCNTVKLSQQYDIWCCGQLLLDMLNKCNINSKTHSILNIYKKCIQKYIIDPKFNERKSCGFVREKIMLDIKHNE